MIARILQNNQIEELFERGKNFHTKWNNFTGKTNESIHQPGSIAKMVHLVNRAALTYSGGSDTWHWEHCVLNSLFSKCRPHPVLVANSWNTGTSHYASVLKKNTAENYSWEKYLGMHLPSSAAFADVAVSASENWINAYKQDKQTWHRQNQFSLIQKKKREDTNKVWQKKRVKVKPSPDNQMPSQR